MSSPSFLSCEILWVFMRFHQKIFPFKEQSSSKNGPHTTGHINFLLTLPKSCTLLMFIHVKYFVSYRTFILSLFLCTYPEIFTLSALIACNAMNWPGGTAIYFSHKFHHWLMLYTLGQYIVNVQWSITGDGFLTIFKFGIRKKFKNMNR